MPRHTLLLAAVFAAAGQFLAQALSAEAPQKSGPDLVPDTCYVFSYFTKNGQDGLHLAWSADGYTWKDVRAASFLIPVLEDKILRDPCIQRGSDGTFHMVWTTSWTKGGFGYASSQDLIHWSEQRYVPAMRHEPKVANTWAPELTWDPEGRRWMIYWASTIPGRFSDVGPPRGEAGSKVKLDHRLYRTFTTDFVHFTPTELFYNDGFSVIDATIVPVGGRYAMVLKDERPEPVPQKNFRLAWAESASGPYGAAETAFSTALTKEWIEGPTVIRIGDTWMLYADSYRKHNYVLFTTRDFKTWKDETGKLVVPSGMRHGTAFSVDRATLLGLLASAKESQTTPAGSISPEETAKPVATTPDAFAAAVDPKKVPVRSSVVEQAVKAGERIWTSAARAEPTPGLSSRDLFSYALALCEAGRHLERLETLFSLATKMQTRDASKRTHGNFRWSWRDADVFDANAVDFCMQSGSLLWLRHRDRLPPAARALFLPLLEFGGEGLLRHRVNESYTNIALMNAGNLILLGEALGRDDLVKEGSARLDRIVLYTAEGGTHEYVSPTYYGVNLDDLLLIETFTRQTRAREQAARLRELLWTDIALNWFAPAAKLGGARSRDYDYLRGLGSLDQHLFANGWLPDPTGQAVRQIYLAYQQTSVSPKAFEKWTGKYPRLVTQRWGLEPWQSRTHYVLRDVSLSSAGGGYGGRMDLPLTFDLPGPRESVRGYFIPDGRHDPYGKVKIQESQAHAKTLHLQPFWAAAQRKGDALGLALYRKKDVPEDARTLESHFVMPRDFDEIWIGEQRIAIDPKQPSTHPIAPGQALTLRRGTAGVGIRVPWSRNKTGDPASVALVNDANPHGALLLTVTHHHVGTAVTEETLPGAAFWVRIGGDLNTSEAFAAWRRAFANGRMEASSTTTTVAIGVEGIEGPVSIKAAAPFAAPGPVMPAHPRHILAVDGDDIGRSLLADTEPVRTLSKRRGSVKPIAVKASGPTLWEAENGWITPPMTLGEDPKAEKGLFVWMPAAPGERAGSSVGRTSWELDIQQAGTYYLWARVLAPTPENDSFRLSMQAGGDTLLPATDWPTSVRKTWTWIRVTLAGAKAPQGFVLPAGRMSIALHVREAGTRVDRCLITAEPGYNP